MWARIAAGINHNDSVGGSLLFYIKRSCFGVASKSLLDLLVSLQCLRTRAVPELLFFSTPNEEIRVKIQY